MSAQPKDRALYERVKRKIYAKYPVHSAYRSGLLVQEYKRRGGTYVGTKKTSLGLSRWFREKWSNQRGGVGYKAKSDVYRPTKHVSSRTPKTFKELSPKQIQHARREKARTGHVTSFAS